MNKSLGQIAWEAYADSVGQTTFDDKPLPAWDQLGERQRQGWEATADAVKRRVTWQSKVIAEKEELDVKIARLKTVVLELGDLLPEQLQAMEKYSAILAERIEDFCR